MHERLDCKGTRRLTPLQSSRSCMQQRTYTSAEYVSMNSIFCFGANRAGRHGRGSALHAVKYHGAIYGQGEGLQGRSYGIPTKDERLRTLSLEAIAIHVDRFISFANANPDLQFSLVPIACGLAGYTPAQIAPMFAGAPANVRLPPEFVAVLDA